MNADSVFERLTNLVARLETTSDDVVLGLTLGPVAFRGKSRDVLWQVLTHPRFKLEGMTLIEHAADALVEAAALPLIQRWLRETERDCPLTLGIVLHSDAPQKSDNFFKDLAEALTIPNNRVEVLHFEEFTTNLGACQLLVCPVLNNSNNALRDLRLNSLTFLSDDDALVLALALESPHCKLHTFEFDLHGLTLAGTLCILESLRKVASLQRLALDDFQNDFVEMPEAQRQLFASRIGQFLERPGNQLLSLRLAVSEFDQMQVSSLANALTNEHCRLEKLDFGNMLDNAVVPLLLALRCPNTRLKSLSGGFGGHEAAAVFGEIINDPNCKLESLELYSEDESEGGITTTILHALKSANSLRELAIIVEGSRDLDAISESLMSPNNKIEKLKFCQNVEADNATYNRLYRAIRRSNVRVCDFWGTTALQFSRVFNLPFLHVLYTLLSVRQFPRLGSSAWIRLLPFHDLVFNISEALGWPLADLSLTTDTEKEIS